MFFFMNISTSCTSAAMSRMKTMVFRKSRPSLMPSALQIGELALMMPT